MTIMVGCQADIEPVAANSVSAIIAVLGEYFLALVSLVLFYVSRITFIGAGLFTFGIYCLSFNKEGPLNLSHSHLLIIGIIFIIAGLFQPREIYNPNVVISHNSWKRGKIPSSKKGNTINGFLSEIIAGVIVALISACLGL